LDNGYLILFEGFIFRNPIGIGGLSVPEGYDLEACLSESVIFIENETNVDLAYLPLPHVFGEDPPTCSESVPWD
jgi:hypothetical protein